MKHFRVDPNLTPENCRWKGYEWWADSIYDPTAPNEVNENFIEMINDGWKLGKPASINFEENGGVGVYKPLNEVKK